MSRKENVAIDPPFFFKVGHVPQTQPQASQQSPNFPLGLFLRTWRAKTEGVGSAETPASNTGCKGQLLPFGSKIILLGWNHQAGIGVKLNEEPVLQHPNHHLYELCLVWGEERK